MNEEIINEKIDGVRSTWESIPAAYRVSAQANALTIDARVQLLKVGLMLSIHGILRQVGDNMLDTVQVMGSILKRRAKECDWDLAELRYRLSEEIENAVIE
jgi:hypothetical protein